MTQYFSQYEVATGRVRFNNECPDGHLPPEGPLYEGAAFAVIHGKCCRHTGLIVDGEVSRISDADAVALDHAAMWFEVRRTRARLLGGTDKMLAPDYPLGWRAKRALKKRRKLSRDITEMTSDPRAALRMLKKTWGSEYVE